MKKITRLAVFDFDGTLVDTPLPEFGKVHYESKTGLQWPHKGWWGRAESMDTSVFDIPLIESVFADYQVQKEIEGTFMVLLTGRMSKFGDVVKGITDGHGLEFDEYHFNTGGSTDVVKVRTLTTLLQKYPDVKEVALWDDRLQHIPIFEEWGNAQIKSGRLVNFNITVVPTDRH